MLYVINPVTTCISQPKRKMLAQGCPRHFADEHARTGKLTYVLNERLLHQIQTLNGQIVVCLLWIDLESSVRTSGTIHQKISKGQVQHLDRIA